MTQLQLAAALELAGLSVPDALAFASGAFAQHPPRVLSADGTRIVITDRAHEQRVYLDAIAKSLAAKADAISAVVVLCYPVRDEAVAS